MYIMPIFFLLVLNTVDVGLRKQELSSFPYKVYAQHKHMHTNKYLSPWLHIILPTSFNLLYL